MNDRTPDSAAPGGPSASRDEIDALGQVIAATLAMAVRTRSAAAAALLDRALEALDERTRAMGGPEDGGRRDRFRAS